MKFILASTSSYRAALLKRLSVDFSQQGSDVDEDSYKEKIRNPIELTETLARQKAKSVFEKNPDCLVLGGDQISLFNGEILGKKKYLRDLSKGNQKKAGIVAALIGNPEVIILDEPFANLDPTTQIRLKQILKDLAQKQGVTILVSSHDLMHVTDVCERIVVLEKGNVVKDLETNPTTLKELEAHFSGSMAAQEEE